MREFTSYDFNQMVKSTAVDAVKDIIDSDIAVIAENGENLGISFAVIPTVLAVRKGVGYRNLVLNYELELSDNAIAFGCNLPEVSGVADGTLKIYCKVNDSVMDLTLAYTLTSDEAVYQKVLAPYMKYVTQRCLRSTQVVMSNDFLDRFMQYRYLLNVAVVDDASVVVNILASIHPDLHNQMPPKYDDRGYIMFRGLNVAYSQPFSAPAFNGLTEFILAEVEPSRFKGILIKDDMGYFVKIKDFASGRSELSRLTSNAPEVIENIERIERQLQLYNGTVAAKYLNECLKKNVPDERPVLGENLKLF